jgi:hypothetical protein
MLSSRVWGWQHDDLRRPLVCRDRPRGGGTRREVHPDDDEVGRLQSGGEAECQLLRNFAEQRHYAGGPRARVKGLLPPRPTARFRRPGTKMTRDSLPASCARPWRIGIDSRPRGRKFLGEDPLEIAQLNRADVQNYFSDVEIINNEIARNRSWFAGEIAEQLHRPRH